MQSSNNFQYFNNSRTNNHSGPLLVPSLDMCHLAVFRFIENARDFRKEKEIKICLNINTAS